MAAQPLVGARRPRCVAGLPGRLDAAGTSPRRSSIPRSKTGPAAFFKISRAPHMRPFLLSRLRCNKCGSSRLPRLIPCSVENVPMPAAAPSLAFYKDKTGHLMELVESISRIKQGVVDADEASIYEFADGTDERAVSSLLYGVDVVEGSICCTECGDEKSIRNSILFCEGE